MLGNINDELCRVGEVAGGILGMQLVQSVLEGRSSGPNGCDHGVKIDR